MAETIGFLGKRAQQFSIPLVSEPMFHAVWAGGWW